MRGHELLFLALAFAAGAVGCDGGGVVGEHVPNAAPDTQIEATPPNLDGTSFQIELFWSGSDPDGEVVAYEWVMTDNGLDHTVAPGDTLGRWRRTTAHDSLFVVSADLPGYPDDVLNEDIDDPFAIRSWQSHSFFVRSVDDKGRRDPSPAHVSFTATTLAPTVRITDPTVIRNVNTCTPLSLAPSFRWAGVDPDAPEGEDIAAVRYTLIQLQQCLTDLSYAAADPIADVPEEDWSEWIRYDAAADSGRLKRYPVLDAPPNTPFLFAVQALDAAGAVTPTFEWNVNVRHFVTSTANAPVLTVNEPSLGLSSRSGQNNVVRVDLVAGQPLEFTWSADATKYGGYVEEFRYGWSIVDPNNESDPGWSVPWGPTWRSASTGGFREGTPNFIVQARDNSGAISRFVYQFQVTPVKLRREQRPLLLVDDTEYGGDRHVENLFQGRWRDLLAMVPGFSPAFDLVPARGPLATELDFAKLNDYRAVIWLISGNQNSFVARNLAPSVSYGNRFNWLEAYQRESGNVFMAGRQAMTVWTKDNSIVMNFPIVLNLSLRPPQGLGTQAMDGSSVNVGTLRHPYTGWCLESIDQTNPAERITGELSREKRTTACDSYVYGMVHPDFVARFLPGPQNVSGLHPTAIRRDQVGGAPLELSTIGLPYEEFYNVNAGTAPITIRLRDCQVPMFTAVARMDTDDPAIMQPLAVDRTYHLEATEPLVDDATCPAVRLENRGNSRVSRAPIAVASLQYIGTKQNTGLPQEDYLWGFNPLGFRIQEVRSTLEWILLRQWRLGQD